MELNVIRYCAEECVRQGKTDPMSTYNMCNAWDYTTNLNNRVGLGSDYGKLTLDIIEKIGILVEPVYNKHGFRQIPIFVGNAYTGMNEKAPWQRVVPLLEMLIDSYYEGEPDNEMKHHLAVTAEDQFYYDFENIHPFRDGNGRTGKILYNYLLGRLDDPILPPNFWGSTNP